LLSLGSTDLVGIGGIGVLASSALFIVGAWLWWRVLEARFNGTVATASIGAFSFCACGYVASMPYSESLFLVLSGLWFSARPASRSRLVAGMLMGLTRITALILVVPSLLGRRGSRPRLLLECAAPLAGFGLWAGFVALLTGRPDGWSLGLPGWLAATGQGRGVLDLAAQIVQGHTIFVPMVVLPALLVVGTWRLRRVWVEGAGYSAAMLIMAFASGTPASIERYSWLAIPAFAGWVSGANYRERRNAMVLLITIGLMTALLVGAGLRDP
jgi:hypothetical protein